MAETMWARAAWQNWCFMPHVIFDYFFAWLMMITTCMSKIEKSTIVGAKKLGGSAYHNQTIFLGPYTVNFLLVLKFTEYTHV